jgi:hypothetical protein
LLREKLNLKIQLYSKRSVKTGRFLFGAIPAVRYIFCFLAAKNKRMPLPSGLGLMCFYHEYFKK